MIAVYDYVKKGIRILRCFGGGGQVELPEQIGGVPVAELGAYAFAETVRRQEPGKKYLAVCFGREEAEGVLSEAGDGLLCRDRLEDGMPVLKGSALEKVVLPSRLEKVGAYAFYNCGGLESLEFSSSLRDLGAGLFTGCHGIGHLTVRRTLNEPSCLKEVLAELRQTLRVHCLDEKGELEAELLFPEYFEESIENTPARILTQEMHGCGHRYRNAFCGKEFQYQVYDRLFPHVQVQEKPELAAELALGRLMYPVQLSADRKKIYEDYAAGHGKEIYRTACRKKDLAVLKFAAGAAWCRKDCLDEMLEEGNRGRDPQALGILMDIRRRKKEAEPAGPSEKKRRFSL